jgi:uncharacterized protein YndB with AHSA1/START domain
MSNAQTSTIPALVIKRTFNASRERVFKAWTTVELLREWYSPPGISVGAVTFEAREGGRYSVAMNMPDGEVYIVSGVITEFRAPERLAYTVRWKEDDPKTEHDTFVSVDFVDRGKQTEIVFTHDGFLTGESRERHDGGWNGCFSRLEELL